MAFTMLCVNLKGTCSGQSKVSPYNKFQHAHGKKDITKTKKNYKTNNLNQKNERRIPNLLLSSNETTDLFEQAVEVHMNAVSTRCIKQDIFTMTITQAKDVTHHTHNRWSATVCQTTHVPRERSYKTGLNWLTAIRKADRPTNRLNRQTDRQAGRPSDR